MGVKSLWSLLTPVGRPVMLETVEGKTMAIDSSIWIYQFQATMRDKEGRGLVNAHVLGFLRRITKLLFYGIKPVFVFDGGAPALKRATITERKKKKAGAAASHAKVAERLLAVQLRREALNHVEGIKSAKSAKGKGKAPSGPVIVDEDTVYLEDLDPSVPRMPQTPSRQVESSKSSPAKASSSKRNKFHDHDPYSLPVLDMHDAIAEATQSGAPDPRLATEDELQAFIEDMRPEDFDVTSPAFRELSTEVQYEIIGDLRLKSRQTSYYRLQNMLRSAPTPLDFSKQQIINLKQRNALTQQLLTTTDSIGKAHISIPVRIASERNREYVLVKNEDAQGGWILGIRDQGTQDKPIEIDQDSDKAADSDSDGDMEEVSIPSKSTADPDLRRYQREMALSAIGDRYVPKKLAPLTTKPVRKAQPLFDLSDEDMEEYTTAAYGRPEEDEDDQMLAYAIQASIEAPQASSKHNVVSPPKPVSPKLDRYPHLASPQASSSMKPITPKLTRTLTSSSTSKQLFADPHISPQAQLESLAYSTRLETALSIGGAGPSRTATHLGALTRRISSEKAEELELEYISDSEVVVLPRSPEPLEPPSPPAIVAQASQQDTESDSDEDMEEVLPIPTVPQLPATPPSPHISENGGLLHASTPTELPPLGLNTSTRLLGITPELSVAPLIAPAGIRTSERQASLPPVIAHTPSPELIQSTSQAIVEELVDSPLPSRSPSPNLHLPGAEPQVSRPSSPVEEDWDAAQEMDAHGEEAEFARFVSQVHGKDIDDVRREIDDEIKTLNQQRKAAMRDSEDITQQMVTQIMTMLRLFGIPYITAPMEAEAQCATLVELGLVEGIITDDSDVFLFGGKRVFKNMFNQSKTVECFLLTDLSRELGLSRSVLIRLAYLLGSDYVDGLPGVGPVVAMELLEEFPGDDGLHKFKDWWLKVQTGKDRPEDSKTKFRQRFKKKFKDLYLPQDWPNPAVRDAYYHPTVDDSEEPFKWGLPDLDALRLFLREELGWQQPKVDELLLPIIQKMGKRAQAAALNKQGNLNEFMDVGGATGNYAPRKRTAYASKRLQKVVSDFRKKQQQVSESVASEESASGPGSEFEEGPAKKKPKAVRAPSKATGPTAGVSRRGKRGRGRGRGRVSGTRTPHTHDATETSDASVN
ncbi:hypothetical protein HGRIS_003465 [Hohenbuehelia grisea]|uniref:PIN domain-like protein n=1 Tax=Hohenbuehelia grisea TaxID=104357 RepID=A0ABR3JFJ0_9AGAR